MKNDFLSFLMRPQALFSCVFKGFGPVLALKSDSARKMMQKSPVASSVALSRLENETVMPNREKLKKMKNRAPEAPGGREPAGSAQKN